MGRVFTSVLALTPEEKSKTSYNVITRINTYMRSINSSTSTLPTSNFSVSSIQSTFDSFLRSNMVKIGSTPNIKSPIRSADGFNNILYSGGSQRSGRWYGGENYAKNGLTNELFDIPAGQAVVRGSGHPIDLRGWRYLNVEAVVYRTDGNFFTGCSLELYRDKPTTLSAVLNNKYSVPGRGYRDRKLDSYIPQNYYPAVQCRIVERIYIGDVNEAMYLALVMHTPGSRGSLNQNANILRVWLSK